MLENSIFKVIVEDGSGTGFMIDGYEYIITNYHVVSHFREVILEDNNKNRYLATVVMVNSVVDIAFLVCDELKNRKSAIKLQDGLEIVNRQKVNIAGYPFGMPYVITEGIISSTKQVMENRYYIQTDAAINSGNSGGPMVDADNNLVAVVNAKFSDADNVGFGIPYGDLQKELNDFKFDDKVYRVKCNSCDNYLVNRVKFCDNCGKAIDETLFDNYESKDETKIMEIIDKSIADYGLNPKLCRVGKDYWEFYPKSNVIRFFTSGDYGFYANSPLCNVPKSNIKEALELINSDKFKPFNIGIYARNNTICLYYRVFQNDFHNDKIVDEVQKNFTKFIGKSVELSEFFINEYGCEVAVESRS